MQLIAQKRHRRPFSASRMFSNGAVRIALAVAMLAMAGGGASIAAGGPQCATNYYSCALNKGGQIDPANPGCCWNTIGKPNKNLLVCPKGYYKCDLNRDGKLDSKHPGCCLKIG